MQAPVGRQRPSGARDSQRLLLRAVRWGWITINPIDQVVPPALPRPNPTPPSAEEAATILTAASQDPTWGTLIWFTMTTGARRGEVCGLRWSDINLDAGVATFRTSIGQIAGEQWEKDPKTHQHRRVTLDPELVDVLREHRARCDEVAAALDTKVPQADKTSGAPHPNPRPSSGGEVGLHRRSVARRDATPPVGPQAEQGACTPTTGAALLRTPDRRWS